MKKIYISLLFSLAFSCSHQKKKPLLQQKIEANTFSNSNEKTKVKRLIIFIGDGLGIGSITAAAYRNDKKLEILSMPEMGWASTHSYEFLTTDSAASATAIATGTKTHFNGMGVIAGTIQENEEDKNQHLESFFDLAKQRKLGTGIVSTARVVHATPGAFYAHRKTRKSYEKIAEDLLAFNPDVVLGAGWGFFRERKDGQNLSPVISKLGYDYTENANDLSSLNKSSKKIMGLFYKKDFPFLTDEKRVVDLSTMVDSAIKILDNGHPEGWVLMVEGSFIDWCEHALRPDCTIQETLDFDAAVGVGRTYLKQRKENDTLIVVTSDHETGGVSVIDKFYSDRFASRIGGEKNLNLENAVRGKNKKRDLRTRPIQHFEIGNFFSKDLNALNDKTFTMSFGSLSAASGALWQSKQRFYSAHTSNFVPIFAEGVAASQVSSARDNAELGQLLKGIISEEIENEPPKKHQNPKNIVLFIGDGMGISSVTASYYAQGRSNMMRLERHGLIAPQSSNHLVPDSAATASILATGTLMPRLAISFDGKSHETLIEKAAKEGKSVGIITTVQITHATPAAFYAHRKTRKDTQGISEDLVSFLTRTGNKIDLIWGGGADDILPYTKKFEQQGYEVSTQWPPKTDRPSIGIFAPQGLPSASEKIKNLHQGAPSLKMMVEKAIERLSKNKKGFVLIVEGGQIDWRLHELQRGKALLDEIAEFDDAVGEMVQLRDPQTLFLVTADHDHTMSVLDDHYAFEAKRCNAAKRCGGELEYENIEIKMRDGFSNSALQGKFSPPHMILQYAWLIRASQKNSFIKGSHSANFVPIFSTGPGSDRLKGFHTQVEIGKILKGF